MPTLPATTIAALLHPYLASTDSFDYGSAPPFGDPALYDRLSTFLDLLMKWNAKKNLTAIRDPEEIVRRHFGESLFLARKLGPAHDLLDFGSGAGFPGVPVQLALPSLKVTLAESQQRKASFLREALRSLELPSEVWAGRVEDMPRGRSFHLVALRAVDRMELALQEAGRRCGHTLLVIGNERSGGEADRWVTGFAASEPLPIPDSHGGVLWRAKRLEEGVSTEIVPRGTI